MDMPAQVIVDKLLQQIGQLHLQIAMLQAQQQVSSHSHIKVEEGEHETKPRG